MVFASVVFALGIAETAAAALRDGAFPYLNIFAADVELGVRLRPHADTAVRSFSGNVTSVRTNSLGFRGPEWSSESSTRVLLVGDSQMFGYNVEYEDTLAAQLASDDVVVFNAAVPSWGPGEYVAVVRELATTHRPTHLIFVANVANDWLESEAPNRLRTSERDGWLVPGHPQLEKPVDFPGRDFLLGRSHLGLRGPQDRQPRRGERPAPRSQRRSAPSSGSKSCASHPTSTGRASRVTSWRRATHVAAR